MSNNSTQRAVNGHDALQLHPTDCPTCRTSSTASAPIHTTRQIANSTPTHSEYTVTSIYFIKNTSLLSTKTTLFLPLCRFRAWIETTDCKTFSTIRTITIQLVCNDTQCDECFQPAHKGARQVRDLLPLLRFALTYKECHISFAVPFGGTARIEPVPVNNVVEKSIRFAGLVPLGSVENFMEVDFTTARNWYEVLFVWASIREQNAVRAERDASLLPVGEEVPGYSIKEHLGRAMGIWEERFRGLCREERVLGLVWQGMVGRVLVDVLGGFVGVDGGVGTKYAFGGRKRIEVEVFKRWE